jgi:creatinine amidohydrolase
LAETLMAGYSIFDETMADMTFPEIAAAASSGAVALWGLGVIEQHGPHLPLATDVYVPHATLRRARQMLAARDIPSVIVPAFYWGVNHVTGRYPGSFEVRPAVMIELMKDVFRSLAKDGFKQIFCLSGHGDAMHNRTILVGVREASREAAIAGSIVLSPALADRLGYDRGDPHLALTRPQPTPSSTFADVHAGDWETSIVWGYFPDLVRAPLLPTLAPTQFGPQDLAEWRKGQEHTLRKAPAGYVGDPSAADAARGLALVEAQALEVADAIAAKLSAP